MLSKKYKPVIARSDINFFGFSLIEIILFFEFILATPNISSLYYRLFKNLPALDDEKNYYLPSYDNLINIVSRYGFKFIKEYPIKSVSIFSNLKSSDLLLVNENYKSE